MTAPSRRIIEAGRDPIEAAHRILIPNRSGRLADHLHIGVDRHRQRSCGIVDPRGIRRKLQFIPAVRQLAQPVFDTLAAYPCGVRHKRRRNMEYPSALARLVRIEIHRTAVLRKNGRQPPQLHTVTKRVIVPACTDDNIFLQAIVFDLILKIDAVLDPAILHNRMLAVFRRRGFLHISRIRIQIIDPRLRERLCRARLIRIRPQAEIFPFHAAGAAAHFHSAGIFLSVRQGDTTAAPASAKPAFAGGKTASDLLVAPAPFVPAVKRLRAHRHHFLSVFQLIYLSVFPALLFKLAFNIASCPFFSFLFHISSFPIFLIFRI